MVLIEPRDPLKLFHIECIVCFGDKTVIGFIYELVGPITSPLYSIQLYPEFMDNLTKGFTSKPEVLTQELKAALHDKRTYVVKRTMKLINSKLDEIMSKKGCDASNIFDEEIPESDQEYSDDELEKEAKRLRKLKSQGKSIEDGEMPATLHEQKQKKRSQKAGQPNKRFKKHDFGDTATIPVYSTNQSILQ